MLSKTKIRDRARKKTSQDVKDTINLALKHVGWMQVAKILSGPTRNQSVLNLQEIDHKAKTGDTIIVTGKVLSKGNLTKKIKICSMSISGQAREKLKETKSEYIHLSEEIKKNPKAEGIKILG